MNAYKLPQAELFMEFDRIENSIGLIKMYEPDEGYWLAFSGGKDSIVLYDLAVKSGVKFTAHYNVTTVDPPELLRFMLKHYPDVVWHRPKLSMYQLIQKKGLPTRMRRWCCEALKEAEPKEGWVLTGIRSEESPRRQTRNAVHRCTKNPQRTFVHPLKDWREGEIWTYIFGNQLPYCQLYTEGWDRIGCVGCPFAKHKARELASYPRIANACKSALGKWWTEEKSGGKSVEEIWDWWVQDKEKLRKEENCLTLFA